MEAASMPNSRYDTSDASSRLVDLFDGDNTTTSASEDSAHLNASSVPKRYALPKDWEQHKEAIYRLYLDENQTLKKVMATMSQYHGHFGSIKMYKNKLKEWGFDTKYKRHQTSRKRKCKRPTTNTHQFALTDQSLAVPANHRVYQSSHLPSTGDCLVEVFTTAVDHILQHFDGACTGEQYFQAIDDALPATSTGHALEYGSQASDTKDRDKQYSQTADPERTDTQNVTRETRIGNQENWQILYSPRYSSALSCTRSAAPPLSIAERTFSLVKQHIETSFMYGIWKADSEYVYTNATHSQGLAYEFLSLTKTCLLLLCQGSTRQGQRCLSKACALIKPLLKYNSILSFGCLWESLWDFSRSGYSDIVFCLIRYIHEMAKILLHPAHPVVQMFKLLTGTNVSDLRPIILNRSQITVDTLEKQLPKLHPVCVEHRCRLIEAMHGTAGIFAAKRPLYQLLKECDESGQVSNFSRERVLEYLWSNLSFSKEWAEAAKIKQEIEKCAKHTQDVDEITFSGPWRILSQVEALSDLDLIPETLASMERATQSVRGQFGYNHPHHIYSLTLRKQRLLDIGKFAVAHDIQDQINEIVEEIDLE